jgi:hypothetical protein
MGKTLEERVERIERLLSLFNQSGRLWEKPTIRRILHEIALERRETEHYREPQDG